MHNSLRFAEEILAPLRGRIAIVGNATCQHPFGVVIDGYDTVIRMNNFRLKGFEHLVGTRTDYRCTTGWVDVEHRNQHVEFSPFTVQAPESRNLETFNRQNLHPVVPAGADIHPFLPDKPNPSTGLALVQLCVNLGLKVDLFGFDGFKTPHYWSNDPKFFTTHSRGEMETIFRRPGVVVLGETYPYQLVHDFCHEAYPEYGVNTGLELVRRLKMEYQGSKVLEFGAGTGGLAHFLSEHGNQVTAIEASRVAWERIVGANKIHGSALALPLLKGPFDLFVSVDVLQHLTQNDLRLVLREAARLCRRIFISIRTQPSKLLGPRGENLHLTVQSADWWTRLFGEFFEVKVTPGSAVDQVIIEGELRPGTAIEINSAALSAVAPKPSGKPPRVVALLAAYNEGDIIYHVIGDLVRSGVEVYFIDNNSTDNTVAEAERWLGKGLIHIERFPQDSGFPAINGQQYIWRDLLRRKEQLAASLGADWYLHTDADEFRESPWPDLNLAEAIQRVDELGANAINFELLNFRPTDNSFVPGGDVREHLLYYEGAKPFDAVQVKAWKNPGQPVDLVSSGGHCARFAGRRIFPIRFLLRHYPIRSESHGRKKVFQDRQTRFNAEERKLGWHVQYDEFLAGKTQFLHDPATLIRYDGEVVRQKLLVGAAAPQLADSAEPPATLTSIVILVLNQLEHTRACLESLETFTSLPHEIIVVDNASTDGTPRFLQEWQKAGASRFVIRNHANRGFAAGNNQALALAKGQTVVLLNNDTIVTKGWLESLLNTFKCHPQTGLAGPMSNNVSGPQCVRDAYQTVAELPAFAEERALIYRGQSVETPRAVGFCLAMSRALIERAGGLDERFGPGNFEDDDLCIRARLAGFGVRVALDSFVHHTGSQTFKGAGIDYQRAMQRNWNLFRAKWNLPLTGSGAGSYNMPQQLPNLVSLKVPLPMLWMTHKADSRTPGFWCEIQTAASPAKARTALPKVACLGNLDSAKTHLGNHDLASAWKAAREAIEIRPAHPEAWLLLARIAREVGDGPIARQCAQYALVLAPGWKTVKQFLQKPIKGNTHANWAMLPAHSRPTRPPGSTAKNAPDSPRLSVCIIAKNEERFIEQCLKSVRDLAWQIIVVDTGSTDRTVEIAKALGAEIHHFDWCDDFGAARNAALEYARGDWILVLDADEELPPDQHARLRTDLSNNKVIAFRLPLVGSEDNADSPVFVPRLFRNAPGAYFTGRIHEQVFPSLMPLSKTWGLVSELGSARLLHHGYAKEVMAGRNKIQRNLGLLRRAIEEQPDDANIAMNLGLELVRSGQIEEGLQRYRDAFYLMSAQPPREVSPELREMLLTQFASQLCKLRAFGEVATLLDSPLARSGGGLTASLHFVLGLAQFELHLFGEAAEQMRQVLAKRLTPSLTPPNPDVLGTKPFHCLALSLARSGDAAGAEKAFQQGLAQPGGDLKLDYARFLADQHRPVEAMQQLHELVTGNARHAAAWGMGGQIALNRPELFQFALDWTGEAVQQLPEDKGLLAQRAEALLLNQKTAAAADLWTQLWNGERNPRFLAALILCEIVEGSSGQLPDNESEARAASRAFIEWYRKCAAAGARELLLRLNASTDELSRVLPEAARMLEAAVAQVRRPAEAELCPA